ncbi:UPF0755 protein [Paenibacillus eucommiae]|uniref:Endolytic murein transglycosylase n=1 Tax=Paenibacillus eucommiae TaxID=1355755 RepID=A0ABS4J759_9BACL|nr:endolytic transglycosylase MltG [Paenibacillus eucommiae]MBP1995692.1 UPF0755 protein [Paenibacillus eucommiae]
MENYHDEQKKSGRRKRKAIGITISLIVLILIGGGIGTALYISSALQPTASSDQEVRVKIPSGTGSAQIAKLLKDEGMIKDSTIFTIYLKMKKEGSRFQAGEYAMKPGMTFDQMIEQMNNGQTVKEEVFRVTIPEGYTIEQIADKLGEQTPWSADEFLQLMDNPEQFKSAAAADLPDNELLKHRLEGYLFPETYEFKKGSTVEDFIERALQELDKKLDTLPSDWQDRMKALNLNRHQMLTIASLIEREVVLDEERPLVAGVIYNRLNTNMKLQIDATVQYLFDKFKERLYEKDLLVDSPYNTYKNLGLPPGPIASPSIASIKAALYPQETKYFFYLTKKDGTQGHLFAETFEEHKKNKTISEQTAK